MTPLYVGTSLNAINSSMIATALVPIASQIGVSVGRTAILVSALYLASSIAQPVGGKLAVEFGPRRIFLAGTATVILGGSVGASGQDLAALVVARVLIGVGSSACYPAAMLLVRRRAQDLGLEAPPGGVLGGLVIAGAGTAAVGLPVGGVLVHAWGWQSTFLINVPCALLALVTALAWIPPDAPRKHSGSIWATARRIDPLGMALFAGTISATLVFLMTLPATNWIALGLAVTSAGLLGWWELRASEPFLDTRLLVTNLALTRTYLRYALTSLCAYTVLYGVTQWLQAGRGMSPQEAGLMLLPMSVLSALVAWPISRRNLVRSPLIVAAVSTFVGSLGVLALSSSTPLEWILIITLVFGLALGTTISANQTALYTQIASGQIATAAGLLRTFGYIGAIASSGIISVAFHTGVSDHHLEVIAICMVIVSSLGLVLVVADRQLVTGAVTGPRVTPCTCHR
ncbi:MFS transporter [Nocardioides sp.]|uniref:MFS transporter n=1 Tax=Nocardioides sp. TaxID=35761 RepID=UPI003D10FDF4